MQGSQIGEPTPLRPREPSVSDLVFRGPLLSQGHSHPSRERGLAQTSFSRESIQRLPRVCFSPVVSQDSTGSSVARCQETSCRYRKELPCAHRERRLLRSRAPSCPLR